MSCVGRAADGGEGQGAAAIGIRTGLLLRSRPHQIQYKKPTSHGGNWAKLNQIESPADRSSTPGGGDSKLNGRGTFYRLGLIGRFFLDPALSKHSSGPLTEENACTTGISLTGRPPIMGLFFWGDQ
jgi:hypothetical protein